MRLRCARHLRCPRIEGVVAPARSNALVVMLVVKLVPLRQKQGSCELWYSERGARSEGVVAPENADIRVVKLVVKLHQRTPISERERERERERAREREKGERERERERARARERERERERGTWMPESR